MPAPTAFTTSAAFARWLRRHHASEDELVILLFKVHARDRGIGYTEALDEALCWGWIDGIRRAHDADSFTVRFTPRRKRSIWSAVNIRHVKRLSGEGRMQPSGLAEFARRDEALSRVYSFENRNVDLAPAYARRFRAEKKAWAHFQTMPPWYRRTSIFWVMSAKREETQLRRLEELMTRARDGLTIKQLTRSK